MPRRRTKPPAIDAYKAKLDVMRSHLEALRRLGATSATVNVGDDVMQADFRRKPLRERQPAIGFCVDAPTELDD